MCSERKKLAGQSDFQDRNDFLKWYKKKEKKCYYCDLTEIESQKLVMLGKLKSNRFPQNGIIGRGKARGVWLEIERKNPKGKYSKANCALCCYFCNNDKSDIFDDKNYRKFQRGRKKFLQSLIKK